MSSPNLDARKRSERAHELELPEGKNNIVFTLGVCADRTCWRKTSKILRTAYNDVSENDPLTRNGSVLVLLAWPEQ